MAPQLSRGTPGISHPPGLRWRTLSDPMSGSRTGIDHRHGGHKAFDASRTYGRRWVAKGCDGHWLAGQPMQGRRQFSPSIRRMVPNSGSGSMIAGRCGYGGCRGSLFRREISRFQVEACTKHLFRTDHAGRPNRSLVPDWLGIGDHDFVAAMARPIAHDLIHFGSFRYFFRRFVFDVDHGKCPSLALGNQFRRCIGI